MSNTNQSPAYRIFSVTKREGDKKPVWTEIGAAWSHKDGRGLNLIYTACPLGEAKIVLRAPKAKQGGAQ